MLSAWNLTQVANVSTYDGRLNLSTESTFANTDF